jgi:hypothetical protein
VLVNVWPVRWIHPSEFAGVPVVSRQSRRDQLVIAAKLALAGKTPAPPPHGPPLSLALISGILESG